MFWGVFHRKSAMTTKNPEKVNLEKSDLPFPYVDLGISNPVFDSTFFYEGRYFDQYGYEKDPPPRVEKVTSQTVTSPKQPASAPRDNKSLDHVDWNHFTKTTTFHGIKYVFDLRSVKLRRLIWLLCVVLAITLFSIQVISRTREYFRYRSNVNVEVIYVDQVEFPSVTICNQNTYRISETVNVGLYDFLNYIYGVDVNEGTDLAAYNLESHDLTETVLTTAHQKDDFIDSCTWKGASCNISEDFDTIFTDFGVCYTFNGGKNSPLYVTQSGSGFALGLILNIEQYEYMKGPQDEAGIKVLLHDPSEVPLVRDLGFAIAPGTHTLVGVSRQVVRGLSSPYGACIDEAPPRSSCITNCRARHTSDKCGCLAVDMPPVDDASICNMTSAYTCVNDLRESLRREGDDCQCDVPCHRVTYEPELSYAHISKLTVDRLSLHDPFKRKQVQNKYETAREVAQRVTKTIAEKDANLMEDVLNWSSVYQMEVSHTYQVLYDDNYLQEKYGTTQILASAYVMMNADFTMLKDDFHGKSEAMNTQTPSFTRCKSTNFDVSTFLDFRDGISPLRNQLEVCADEQDNSSEAGTTPEKPVYYTCSEEDSTFTYLYYKKIRAEAMGRSAKKAVDEIDRILLQYEELIDFMFGNTSRPVLEHPQHIECSIVLNATRERWLPMYQQVQYWFELYVNETSWTNKIEIVDKLIAFLNDTYANESLTNMDLYNSCHWYQPEGGAGVVNDRAFSLFLAHNEAGEKSYMDAKGMVSPLLTQGQQLMEQHNLTSLEIFRPIKHFFDFNYTKLDLFQHFLSPDFKVAWSEMKLTNDRFLADFSQFSSKVLDLKNNNRQAFFYSFNFSSPVMNDSVIAALQHVAYAHRFESLDAELGHCLTCLVDNRENCLLAVIDLLYGKYQQALQEVQNNVLRASQELDDAITELQSELTTFAQSNVMDDNFFMENYIKLEIFYKELSYESLRQQVAFEFLSLVSEVGGFMGLLLGASVLTFCELVDYLVLSGIRKCKKASAITINKDTAGYKTYEAPNLPND